ncbi:MAG: hypothetical protein KGJ55_03545 [Gammaproteobacteria bacterium]|nr:hypothetical protein [Gammaproteobacteria bacterium]
MVAKTPDIVFLQRIGRTDLGLIDGRNASRGMIPSPAAQRVRVPPGCATTAGARLRSVWR